jgi:serine/threonine protein kinase
MNTPVTAHSDPQPPPNLVDQRIGKYRVVRKLGEGGMGSVFEAVHVEIGQRAAVKLLKPELSSEPKHVQRFFDEAKLLSMVNHPGLIKIFDFDRTADGQVYIVMELLEGETLWSRFEKHQVDGHQAGMALEEVARMVRQVASALAAVHQRGIIHRDLKPENVFVVKDAEAAGGERAKILDFGIARLEDPSGEGRRTTAGVAIGTPTYMAPEQCEGSATINDRVDVYALGCMSFELLTGAPPFQSASMAAVLRMHIVRPPPPLPATIPAPITALITQMLAKEAKDRPSMSEVVQRLEEHFGARGSQTAIPLLTAKSASRKPVLMAAAVALSTLALGTVTWVVLGRKPPPRVDPPKITQPVEPKPKEVIQTAPPKETDKAEPPKDNSSTTPVGPGKTPKSIGKPPKRDKVKVDEPVVFGNKKKVKKGTPP